MSLLLATEFAETEKATRLAQFEQVCEVGLLDFVAYLCRWCRNSYAASINTRFAFGRKGTSRESRCRLSFRLPILGAPLDSARSLCALPFHVECEFSAVLMHCCIGYFRRTKRTRTFLFTASRKRSFRQVCLPFAPQQLFVSEFLLAVTKHRTLVAAAALVFSPTNRRYFFVPPRLWWLNHGSFRLFSRQSQTVLFRSVHLGTEAVGHV